MNEKGEVLYELKPKFDFLYELTMPTGKKMKASFLASVITLLISILFQTFKGKIIELGDETILNVYSISSVICIIFFIFSLIIFVVRIIIQVLEYKGMSYKFYRNRMVFENNFLSQTKKTIEYSNIKEVEIRRTIIDRILNYGIIIIYTNADKVYGNTTIIYAIRNIKEHYSNIENLIHSGTLVSSPIKTGNLDNDLKNEIDLQNAMNRTETYNESYAESDVNPMEKNNE